MFNGHENESLLMWKAEKKALCCSSAMFRLPPSLQTAILSTLSLSKAAGLTSCWPASKPSDISGGPWLSEAVSDNAVDEHWVQNEAATLGGTKHTCMD